MKRWEHNRNVKITSHYYIRHLLLYIIAEQLPVSLGRFLECRKWYYITYNMRTQDLPDIYARTLRPAALGLGHIYQANLLCLYYNYYIYIYIYTYVPLCMGRSTVQGNISYIAWEELGQYKYCLGRYQGNIYIAREGGFFDPHFDL